MNKPRPPATEGIHPRAGELELEPLARIVRRLHEEDRSALAAVSKVLPQVARLAEAAQQTLRGGGRLLYVGAGTSGRLGALDASELPPTFGSRPSQVVALVAGGHVALHRAVEAAEDRAEDGARAVRAAKVGPGDLVIGITASGRTPYVLGALSQARRSDARTGLVCCDLAGRRAKVADLVVAMNTGPELVAGSTRLKAGTATKLVLNAISTAAMIGLGKVYRGRMVDLRPSNQKLKARAQRMVCELSGLKPAQATSLLRRAGGSPKLALAMHLSGQGPRAAARLVRERGLRALENSR